MFAEVVQKVMLRSDVFDRTEACPPNKNHEGRRESDSKRQILQSLRSFRMTYCFFLVRLGMNFDETRRVFCGEGIDFQPMLALPGSCLFHKLPSLT